MLLAKALVTIEGIGRQLDPDFNMISHMKPFMKKLIQEKVSPGNLSRDFFRTTADLWGIGQKLAGRSQGVDQSNQPQQIQNRS